VTVPAITLGSSGPGMEGPAAAVLPLAGAGVQVVALAGGAVELRRQLDAGLQRIGALSV
jgi:hypothetical protein